MPQLFQMPPEDFTDSEDVFAHQELIQFVGLPGLQGTSGRGGGQPYCVKCPYRPSCPGLDQCIRMPLDQT